MSMITESYKQAELALAAYSALTTGISGNDYTDALKDGGKGMASDQASAFASTWSVITQYTDPGTGLSATVFQEVSSGNRYLAVRGTEPNDFLRDIIINDGLIAVGYLPDVLPQYRLLKDQVAQWISDGTLSNSFTVSGHSLGGYLVTALTADFAANVTQTYLYNAPGLNGVLGGATAAILEAFGITAPVDPSRVFNIKADAGISPIAGLGAQVAATIAIHIENQFLSDVSDPPGAFNHSQQILTDALAVYPLFAELSPTLSVEQITAILKADSNQNAATLESAVQALAKLYLPGTPDIPRENRDALYTAMYDLQQNTLFQQDAGLVQVQPLIGLSRATLVTQAQTDLAYRYALKELNPFALTGDDALYAPHNAHGELDLYDPATGAGTLTDAYLQDRAAFLTWANKANTEDKTTVRGPNGPENWQFTDQAKSYTLNVIGQVLGSNSQNPYRKVIFDGDTAGWVEGGTEADHLYGGGGDDILKGNGGNDHLEGGQGLDELQGGTGNDTLVGGAGADYLTGGKDSDILQGGLGNDSYIFSSGDGWDWIDDIDGAGQIKYDDTILAGGKQVAPNVWQQKAGDATYTYSLYDRTENGQTFQVLAIQGPSGGMWVKHWQDGQLGISLQNADALPPTTDLYGTGQADNSHLQDATPSLESTASNQKVYGLGGADYLKINQAGGIGYGGVGNDAQWRVAA
jgi:pimeloyl-ACP methyl ester carboxylesterase